MFQIPISCLSYLCAKYTFFYSNREKRIRTSEDTTNPTTHEEGKIPTHREVDVEGEVDEVGEIVTTTGDVDVVEEETHFNSASAQILISEIMVFNRDLEKVRKTSMMSKKNDQHH
ncbi:hypothetical protein AB205_0203840 [Aquarana catesbeiana]|uniref:Uncharacterized protein n=1 Tax=Aquarana catesbeiana TaxID=8400 RepID=A0A2G9RH12_AQUCT|nr:hypothetical protein AB205_0203840 [Aquarana catesbeiana]